MTSSSCAGMNALAMAASSRRQGGPKVGKTQRGKGTKWMVLVDGAGPPLGAVPGRGIPGGGHPPRADAGHERRRPAGQAPPAPQAARPRRARLARRGIEPILPARRNHRRATHQDGRQLRRYRRRWMVERTFAWLGHFRRLVVRDERLRTTSAGFCHLACALLTVRRVLK
jgi:transposase